jgi:hypothetical protein
MPFRWYSFRWYSSWMKARAAAGAAASARYCTEDHEFAGRMSKLRKAGKLALRSSSPYNLAVSKIGCPRGIATSPSEFPWLSCKAKKF